MMSRITNRLGWGVAGALGIALLATLAGVIYAGPLSPPGAPAATGPTQIFQPADCTGFPITISSPGSYVLEQNITGCTGKNGIEIGGGPVTLDLNGFSVTGVPGSLDGIETPAGPGGLTVRNGSVENWGGRGIVWGTGRGHLEDLEVAFNGTYGIFVTADATLHNIVARDNGTGIYVQWSVLDNCTANHNAGSGIEATQSTVTNCTFINNLGDGIHVVGPGTLIANNTVSANADDGIRVTGTGNNIEDNTVTGNNTATGSLAAINVLAGADRNRIDSNYIEANSALHGVEVDGTSNTITRNTGGNSTALVFNFAGAGNTFGPVQLQATPLTNPWANIVY